MQMPQEETVQFSKTKIVTCILFSSVDNQNTVNLGPSFIRDDSDDNIVYPKTLEEFSVAKSWLILAGLLDATPTFLGEHVNKATSIESLENLPALLSSHIQQHTIKPFSAPEVLKKFGFLDGVRNLKPPFSSHEKKTKVFCGCR